MRIFRINQDMDQFRMSQMKAPLENLARGPDDICLDLSRVRFLDAAGVDQIATLSSALQARSLDFSVVHAQGQPLRRLQSSQVGWRLS
jgi:anti-anti-sigma regulatory factor